MDRADVLKAEVSRLVHEQHNPVCFVDGKSCFSNGRGCFRQNFGNIGDAVIWACSRFPKSQLDSEPLELIDFEDS